MQLQARTKTVSTPGLTIAPTKDPEINAGRNQESDKYDDASLLGRASLARDPEGDDIFLLGDDAHLTGGNGYSLGDESIGVSTETVHTST